LPPGRTPDATRQPIRIAALGRVESVAGTIGVIVAPRSRHDDARRTPPVYTACVTDQWKYEDLGDDLLRWEVTPGGAVPGIPVFPFTPWKAFAVAVTTAFPNHRITAGFLVDDSCSFFPAACGKAYYDLVTIENRTLEI
jgi:hypothetical protein